jgi:hypothetical protein
MHPFINNLNELTMTELEEKAVLLQRRYFQTANLDLQNQIRLALDTYKDEIAVRRAQEAQRQKEHQDGENGLDNLINVS